MLWSLTPFHALAQLDPERRDLIQLGYNQPLEGRGPISGYAYYYMNRPEYHGSNGTLRIAIAPTYLDAEFGRRRVLGPYTDLSFGVAGGGFADTYSEVRQGKLMREESFAGHGGEVSANLYHQFNPGSRIPLNAVMRSSFHYSTYEPDTLTDPAFRLPHDQGTLHLRGGLRWGGQEPVMFPAMAMELSAWYESQIRGNAGSYGFAGDRELERVSHVFWTRALIAYTLPECRHYFSLGATLGTTIHPDRLSSFRLGGSLPLVAEFPLSIPGYYFQELTARRFFLMSATYGVPLDKEGHCEVMAFGSTAVVSHFSNFAQPGGWQSGVGSAVVIRPGRKAWQISLGYGYGVDAIRNGHPGAHSIGLLLQYDLEQGGALVPGRFNPSKWRGLNQLFGR